MRNSNKIKQLAIITVTSVALLAPSSQALASGGFYFSYGYSPKKVHKKGKKKHFKKHYHYGYGYKHRRKPRYDHFSHRKHKKHIKHKPHRKHIRKHKKHSSRRFHNHNHGYEVYGFRQHLPFGAIKIVFKGKNYYHHHGKYYRKCKFGYDIIRAPIGLCISRLPYGYQQVRVHGDNYYLHDDTYYRKGDDGYVVIHEPEYEVTYYENYNDSY